MKALKTLFLFVFSILVTSCFESPKFDNVPHIEYRSIYFGLSKDPSLMDSLVVELAFEDGDGNLGLDNNYRNEPFHEVDFFLTDGTQLTTKVRERYPDNTNNIAFLDVPPGASGKIVRLGDLPGLPPNSCDDYKTGKINVLPEDAGVFDNTYTVVEKQDPTYYEVSGTFLVEPNENNKNIIVHFFYANKENPQNPEDYTEQEWPCQNFNGRFQILSDDESALSGTLRYTMSSFGFSGVMSDKNWQLRFTIKDRDLNTSNEVSTQLFTLDEITNNCD